VGILKTATVVDKVDRPMGKGRLISTNTVKIKKPP